MSEIVKVPVLPVWQPWAWYLVRGHEHPGGKRVENRSRPLPKTLAGRWCLIHATTTPGMRGRRRRVMSKGLAAAFFDALRIAQRAGLYASGGTVAEWNAVIDDLHFGGLVGAVKFDGEVRAGDDERVCCYDLAALRSPWFSGPVGWTTVDAKPLPFVAFAAHQGINYVPLADLPAEYRELIEALEG